MAKSLRSKLKATKIKALKEQEEQDDKISGGSGSRAGYLDITNGTNRFRLFPAHPVDKGDPNPFYQMKVVHWVSIEKEDGTMGRRPVLNAKVHGGAKKDLFEEYISRVKGYLEDNEDEDAAQKIKLLTDWKNGISHSNSWMCYALKLEDDDRRFGLLEFKKSVRDGLNEVASLEDDDEPIEIDPFTDPDDGLSVIVKYNNKAKKAADYYTVTLGRTPKVVPLTDEEIDDFMEVPSLIELYKNVYTSKDFELAAEGIRNYDEEHEIGFCDTDEWEELVESLNNFEAGDDDDEDDDKPVKKSKKPKKAKKKKVEVEENDEDEEDDESDDEDNDQEEDEYTDMDRKELKKLIKKRGLNIKITSSKTDEDLREEIRSAAEEVEEADEDEEEDEAPPKKAKKSKKTKDTEGAGVSLSDIKKKLKKKK